MPVRPIVTFREQIRTEFGKCIQTLYLAFKLWNDPGRDGESIFYVL